MAQVIIEDALLREPNLLIPGKKPVGPVKIDWGHPLAQGLEDYWLFNGLYGNRIKNLGHDDGADLDIVGSDWKFQTTRWYTTSPNQHPAGDGNISLQSNNGGLTHLPYIGYYSGSYKSYGNVYTVITLVSTGNGDAYVAGPSGNGIDGYCINSKYHAAGGSYDQFVYTANTGWGRYETIALSRNGTTAKLYRDSILLDTQAGFTAGANYQCYQLGGNSPATWFNRQGETYCGVWKRELSSSEIAQVTTDPYQFLIPA